MCTHEHQEAQPPSSQNVETVLAATNEWTDTRDTPSSHSSHKARVVAHHSATHNEVLS